MAVRSVHALAAAAFAIPLVSVWHGGWAEAAIAGSLVVIAIRRPWENLLIIAGLLPLVTPLGELLRPALAGPEAAELLLLPSLFGFCVRYALRAADISSPLRLPCAAGTIVVAAATIVGVAGEPDGGAAIAARYFQHATSTYLVQAALFPALHIGMVWIEAMFLGYFADLTIRQQSAASERMSTILIAGAFAASLFTIDRLANTLLLHHLSVRSTLDALSTSRIGIHTPDVNAVGSLYALFVVPALWSAAATKRSWRWLAFICIAVALWWTGSRAAVAAACAGTLVAAAIARSVSLRTVVLGAAVSVFLVSMSLQWGSSGSLSAVDALRIRVEMGKAGLRIAENSPVFGVGPGRFPAASRPFVSERVLALFPIASDGENAHNNFIQVVAELGIAGAVALFGFIGIPLLAASRAIAMPVSRWDINGFTGGSYAFLLTCLFGHPLLVPLCVCLFFLTLGLVSGLSPAMARPTRLWSAAAWVSMLIVAISIPWRIVDARSHPYAEPMAIVEQRAVSGSMDDNADSKSSCGAGLQPCEALDGVSYTIVERSFAMYIDPRSHTVTVPLRFTPDSSPSCEVHISMNRQPADIVSPPRDAWLRARYVVAHSPKQTPGRLDLLVRESNCHLRVGQMIVE